MPSIRSGYQIKRSGIYLLLRTWRRKHLSGTKVHQTVKKKQQTLIAKFTGHWSAGNAREWNLMMLTRIWSAILLRIMIHAALNISESKPKKKMALGASNKPRDKNIFKELESYVQSRKVRPSKKNMKKLEMNGRHANLKPTERENCSKSTNIVC